MSATTNPLTRKRVSILHRYFSHACDASHPFQPEQLIALRHRFAVNASVQKIPDSHKWLLKIKDAFEQVLPTVTSGDKVALYETANNMFNDNEDAFLSSDPENTRLGLQKITFPVPAARTLN